MKVRRTLLRFFVFVLITGSISGCSVINQYSRYPGVSYIAHVGPPLANSLVWSPKNPNSILVNAGDIGYGHAQVFILDIKTNKRILLAETNYGSIWSNTWSPDGKKIVLSVSGATKGFSKSGLWIIDTENNSMEYLTDKFGDAVWLPDSNTIAILTVDMQSNLNPRRVSISLVDIQTKELELIYSNEEARTYLGFSSSPDGRYFIFSLNSNYYRIESDLYTLDVQTRTVNQITNDGGSSFPQWSPYGDLIAYQKTYTINGKREVSLHLILPDGRCDIEVPNVDDAFSPTWSSDGKKVAFIGNDDIYILDTEVVLGRDIYQNLCP